MRLKHISLLLLFLLWSCSTVASQHLIAHVSPEPKNYAWWLRTDFIPVHKEIRGIPIEQIDSSWRLASEFVSEALPQNENFGGLSTMQELNLSFFRSGDFNHDGGEDLALVGIYENQSRERDSFILILSKNTKGEWQKVFVETLGPPVFAALSNKQEEPIELWFCMYCDHGVSLIWDKKRMQYQLKPFENEEDAF